MSLLGRLFGDGERESPEERFWKWFAANSARLARFEMDMERVFDELGRELHRVHSGLTFEFGPEEADGRQFAVSADGNPDAFPAVMRLVEAAPPLPGWQVVAFRQRAPAESMAEFEISYGDVRITPDDIWFTAEPDGARAGITLYVRGLPDEEREPMQGAVYIMLDTALGEYDVETKVGWLEWEPLPADPAARGLRPFRELPAAVDALARAN